MILRKKFSDVSLFHMYYRVLNMCLHHTWMNVASGFEACVHSYLGIRQLIGGVGSSASTTPVSGRRWCQRL